MPHFTMLREWSCDDLIRPRGCYCPPNTRESKTMYEVNYSIITREKETIVIYHTRVKRFFRVLDPVYT